jgi:hypothetical protein
MPTIIRIVHTINNSAKLVTLLIIPTYAKVSMKKIIKILCLLCLPSLLLAANKPDLFLLKTYDDKKSRFVHNSPSIENGG